MIGRIILIVALSVGSRDVFAENQENSAPDVRARQMEFAGAAKPFTDKFLQEINTNSEAFKSLFDFANYKSQLNEDVDEQEFAIDHCKLIHRSQATELMLEVGLIFQEKCLGDVKVLSPEIDKTVAAFLDELKESDEDAHKDALDCGKNEKKGPELLLECLRAVIDDHFLPLHSYLDTLAVMYVKMVDILKNMETCERNVIEIIEKEIEKLMEEKVMVNCARRSETIANYFDSLSDDIVQNAVRHYVEKVSSFREGVEKQMDVVLTRRPLRTMIKVIGKFLENEARKMSEEMNKRIEAIEKLDKKFEECIFDTPAELKDFLNDSLVKLSTCGVSVSNLQYEFDVGLSKLAEKAVIIFSSLDEDAIVEACVSNDETDLEKVNCIKKLLLNQVSEMIVPLERSVSELLYEQFLNYTNMDAHLTVKECITDVTQKMNQASIDAMKEIQGCVTGGQQNSNEDKDEL